MKFFAVFLAVAIVSIQAQSWDFYARSAAEYIRNNFNRVSGTDDWRIIITSQQGNCLYNAGLTVQNAQNLIGSFGSALVSEAYKMCNSQFGSGCSSIGYSLNVATTPFSLTLKNLPANVAELVSVDLLASAIKSSSVIQNAITYYGETATRNVLACFA